MGTINALIIVLRKLDFRGVYIWSWRTYSTATIQVNAIVAIIAKQLGDTDANPS